MGTAYSFLPNRFDKGIIKTSDAVYQMPVNEKKLDNLSMAGCIRENTK